MSLQLLEQAASLSEAALAQLDALQSAVERMQRGGALGAAAAGADDALGAAAGLSGTLLKLLLLGVAGEEATAALWRVLMALLGVALKMDKLLSPALGNCSLGPDMPLSMTR